jgi:hypothetical protein
MAPKIMAVVVVAKRPPWDRLIEFLCLILFLARCLSVGRLSVPDQSGVGRVGSQ